MVRRHRAPEDPHTDTIMVAPGPLLAGVPRKHVKIQVANGPLTDCIMVAPGPLLAGVPLWAVENFLIAPQKNADWGRFAALRF